MGPLRVVHYLPEVKWSIGGVVRAVLDWCDVFAKRGHEVTLITADATDVPAAWKIVGDPNVPRVKLVDPPARLGKLNAVSMNIVRESLQSCDIVHLHAPWTPSNVQVAKVADQLAKPYVLTVHGMLDDWPMAQRPLKKRLYLALAGRRLLDRAAAVHCTAAAELEQARKWFSNPRTAVLPYLFDLSELMNLPGPELARETFDVLRAAEPKVLFLSRLHEKKGVDLLIDAASILRDRNIPFRVAIAGDGDPAYEQALRARVAQLGLESIVSFLGLVKGPLKFSVYQAADLFVLPTSQENFGLVLPESLACRTPVITTRGVDIWRELEQGGAIIVDRTPAAIADAVASLLADPSRRDLLSRRGRDWVVKNLDPEKSALAYEKIYADCIGVSRVGN
jgi:glycosyltransferase involved in cell wall biosynthesis